MSNRILAQLMRTAGLLSNYRAGFTRILDESFKVRLVSDASTIRRRRTEGKVCAQIKTAGKARLLGKYDTRACLCLIRAGELRATLCKLEGKRGRGWKESYLPIGRSID